MERIGISLGNINIIPAVVVSAADDQKLGRVKVAAPGYFDTATMDIEALPWVKPFLMIGYQSFSSMMVGAKVWLLDVTVNEEEFWYIPYPEMNVDAKNSLGSTLDTDIILSRNIAGSLAQIYQNGEDGIMIRYGNAIINLTTSGEVILSSGEGKVRIAGGQVYLGNGNENHAAIKGSKLLDKLREFAVALAGIKFDNEENAGTQLNTAATDFLNSLEETKSNGVVITG